MDDHNPTGESAGTGAGSPGRSAEDELAALDLVIKRLQARAKVLREALPEQMKTRRARLVSAYDDTGEEELARVRYVDGAVSVRVTDQKAAVAWAGKQHPDWLRDIVIIAPEHVNALIRYAEKVCRPGDHGIDPETGERLDFILVTQGDPFVKVEPTPAGRARAEAFASRIVPELTA